MAKKSGLVLLGIILLVLMGLVSSSGAGVSVEVQIGAPPPVRFYSPPEVVVIPGTYVYYAPDASIDLFFYEGFWWRPWHGYWYRSRYYGGPWAFMPVRRVPGPIVALPPGWHGRPSRFERIPYGQLRRNWRHWERERYWEKDERWHERGDHHGMGHGEHEDHGRGMGMGRDRE